MFDRERGSPEISPEKDYIDGNDAETYRSKVGQLLHESLTRKRLDQTIGGHQRKTCGYHSMAPQHARVAVYEACVDLLDVHFIKIGH
jgi:hypothetical protein